MSDDPMDERLRDYAARWTAARPAPPALTPSEVVRERGRSWVPYAAAATVVALVAGVAYAVAPRGDRPPVAAPAPPASSRPAPASYEECDEEGVATQLTARRDDITRTVELTLDLTATGEPCTLPKAPVVDIRGDNRKDLGVRYRYAGADTEVLLTSRPRRLMATWGRPFCAKTTIVVAVVTLTEKVGSKHPIERSAVPGCHGATGTSIVSAAWVPTECATEDYEAVSAELTRTKDYAGRDAVDVVVLLRNVSTHFCDVNVKPFLVVHTATGRKLGMSHMQTDDARSDPGLPPGGVIRARVLWWAYCGEPLGEYRAEIALGRSARVPFDPGARPVPGCDQEAVGNRDGAATSDWVERVPGG